MWVPTVREHREEVTPEKERDTNWFTQKGIVCIEIIFKANL